MLILKADNLNALTGIAHGFFGRTGGVSTGIYASLNCGFSRLAGEKDGPGAVVENRRKVLAALGAPQEPEVEKKFALKFGPVWACAAAFGRFAERREIDMRRQVARAWVG